MSQEDYEIGKGCADALGWASLVVMVACGIVIICTFVAMWT